jgi:hypothetical protein
MRIIRNVSIKDATINEIKLSGSKLVTFQLVIQITQIRRVIIKYLHLLLVTISTPELIAHQNHNETGVYSCPCETDHVHLSFLSGFLLCAHGATDGEVRLTSPSFSEKR